MQSADRHRSSAGLVEESVKSWALSRVGGWMDSLESLMNLCPPVWRSGPCRSSSALLGDANSDTVALTAARPAATSLPPSQAPPATGPAQTANHRPRRSWKILPCRAGPAVGKKRYVPSIDSVNRTEMQSTYSTYPRYRIRDPCPPFATGSTKRVPLHFFQKLACPDIDRLEGRLSITLPGSTAGPLVASSTSSVKKER